MSAPAQQNGEPEETPVGRRARRRREAKEEVAGVSLDAATVAAEGGIFRAIGAFFRAFF